MTNQSREAFEKWTNSKLDLSMCSNGTCKYKPHYTSEVAAWAWSAWQAALSEGRRQGIEESIQVCECDLSARFPDLYMEFMRDEIENAEDLMAAALRSLIDKRSTDGDGMGPRSAEKAGAAL